MFVDEIAGAGALYVRKCGYCVMGRLLCILFSTAKQVQRSCSDKVPRMNLYPAGVCRAQCRAQSIEACCVVLSKPPFLVPSAQRTVTCVLSLSLSSLVHANAASQSSFSSFHSVFRDSNCYYREGIMLLDSL